jgi:hypothetical protein
MLLSRQDDLEKIHFPVFCSPELHFFRKERFNSCPKITSFGTSRAAFQKIIFHGFLFQLSNQISLLPKFLPCINDAKEVSENFNSFFSTVADKIGQNVIYDPSTHPSIVEIKNRVDIDNNFDFIKIVG